MSKASPKVGGAQAIRTELGERIRLSRVFAGLSQEELAHAVGYAAATPISMLETGKVTSIDVALLVRVSQAYDVDFTWLMEPAAAASLVETKRPKGGTRRIRVR